MKIVSSLRKHHYVKAVSVFLIVLALIAGMPGCGSLQLTDPIEIRTWYDLSDISYNMSAHYILMNDLDSSTPGYEELAGPTADGGQGWLPIRCPTVPAYPWFTGVFEGQGYEIRDLFINRPDTERVGLFSQIIRLGEIRNVRLVNASVTGGEIVGGLVGMMWRDSPTHGLTNCYFSGNVTGTDFVGGLLGDNARGSVNNSHATGSVTGANRVGGLVGHNRENGTVSNSYASGNVTGNDGVGGLVGGNWGNLSNSYATGSVTGNEWVGGLAGQNSHTVSNSYATGNVTGNGQVGGLLGRNDEGLVSNSYSTGSVTGNYGFGGLVGVDTGTVTNCFWDIETSGLPSSDGGTGKTTAEMQDIATFLDAGWSIIAVANPDQRNSAYNWNMVDLVTYPVLSWQSA